MIQKNAVRGYFGDIFDELPKLKSKAPHFNSLLNEIFSDKTFIASTAAKSFT